MAVQGFFVSLQNQVLSLFLMCPVFFVKCIHLFHYILKDFPVFAERAIL